MRAIIFQRCDVTAFLINMGENQKEIEKQQQPPDNFVLRHCPKTI